MNANITSGIRRLLAVRISMLNTSGLSDVTRQLNDRVMFDSIMALVSLWLCNVTNVSVIIRDVFRV